GWNPRVSFGDEKDEELKNSIIENGILIPLRVKKNGSEKFELIDGERRLRAVRKAIEEGNEIESVPCIFEKKNLNQIDGMITALLANEGKPLAPSEEAEAYQRLRNWGLSVEKIAKKVGKSVPAIYNKLKLVDASPEVKEAVNNKNITQTKAHEIIQSSNGNIEEQNSKLNEVVVNGEGDGRKNPKQENNGNDGEKKSKKKARKSVDIQEIRDLMNEAVNDYKDSTDEEFKQFCGGMIRVYANILEEEDPIELDY
ncbi:MAG: ParB/RepB/Spo0J family partition protein, partial [bacterium]